MKLRKAFNNIFVIKEVVTTRSLIFIQSLKLINLKSTLTLITLLFFSLFYAYSKKNIEDGNSLNCLPQDSTKLALVLVNDSVVIQSSDTISDPAVIGDIQKQLIAYAKKYIGSPYRYGGRTPAGFDCSGFVHYVFKNFGQKLPTSSRGMATIGCKVPMQKCNVGDIILFEGRSRNGITGHVGIVCNVDSCGLVSFIHASTTRNVIISTMKEDYYDKRFLQIRRVDFEECSDEVNVN
jgi:cell wall-associated NlpC family hydrolase